MSKDKTKNQSDAVSQELTAEQVIDYLNQHQGFIREHLEQLSDLDIPHHSGVATSLIERQVGVLRSENLQLKANLAQLIDIARNNEELSQKIHQLFLGITNAESLDDLMAIVQEQMQAFFKTDVVLFRYFSMNDIQPFISDDLVFRLKDAHTKKLKKWLAQRKPACGELTSEVFASLFAKEKNIQSMAVIPLYGEKEYGVLMLGSSDVTRFSEDKGVIFLEQLGELVSSRLVKMISQEGS